MNLPFFWLQALPGIFKNPQTSPQGGDGPSLSSISLLLRILYGRQPKLQSDVLMARVSVQLSLTGNCSVQYQAT